MQPHSPLSPEDAPLLVFDGGCPFCSHFAAISELRGGIPDLRLCDGRSNHALRRELAARGFPLSRGAIVLEGGRIHHGAAAIQWICARMAPSGPLLAVLTPLFADPARARRLYPLLLLARRLALGLRGMPEDPDWDAAVSEAGFRPRNPASFNPPVVPPCCDRAA